MTDLFATPKRVEPAARNNPAKADLRAETASWIEANPADANRFLLYARQMLLAGVKRISIKALGERVRWDLAVEKSRVRINNNALSYIARWLIRQEPRLESLIQFRETRY